MSNSEHSGTAPVPRSFRTTFGPVREVELVWPPSDEDLDAFTVVEVGDHEAAPPRVKPTFGDCRARGTAPRVRPLVVPMEPRSPAPPSIPTDDAPAIDEPWESPAAALGIESMPVVQSMPVVEPPPAVELRPAVEPLPGLALEPAPVPLSRAAALLDRERFVTGQSASLAVLVAAACLVVAVVQYQAFSFVTAETSTAAVEPPPLPAQLAMADLPPAVSSPVPITTPTRRPAPTPAQTPAGTRTPGRRPEVPAPVAAASARPERRPEPPAARVTVTARDAAPKPAAAPPRVVPPPGPTLVARAAPAAPRPTDAPAHVTAPTPTPLPAPATVSTPAPEALATATAAARPVSAALASAASTDEADIRSALTRFRTAYSQLDAGAARDVWPSVDRRALERAFQSLKSQDLRFDQCKLTVAGARAQAACKGRATYVPRIGDQSPRYTTREWTFELQKAAERWTISSARSL